MLEYNQFNAAFKHSEINVVGFTCGAFDLLHPGHVHLLQWAKTQCSYLIVGLHTNPSIERPETKHIPIQTVFERWTQLRALSTVDEIIPYDTEQDLINILATANINVRIVGSDYNDTSTRLTGHDICELRKIAILYAPRLHTFSSSELRKRLMCASSTLYIEKGQYE